MKHTKLFRRISNMTLGIGAAFALFAIYRIISTTASLPPGACPIDTGRPIIYVAIGFLVISFITSFFAGKKKAKAGKDSTR